MSEPVRIVVIVEGGIVQNVLTLGVPVEVTVIDYDVEGGDRDQMHLVPQQDGEPARAYVSRWAADPASPAKADFVIDFAKRGA